MERVGEQRIALAKNTDGSYALPCGCRLDIWDGVPEHSYATGRGGVAVDVYEGNVDPHLHVAYSCLFHNDPPVALRALLYGEYGVTHQGAYDLAAMIMANAKERA